jgi:hypothetical protein
MSTAQPDAYARALAEGIQRSISRAYAEAGIPTATATGTRPDFSTPPYTREEVTLLVIRLFRAHLSPAIQRIAELERRLALLESELHQDHQNTARERPRS